MIKLKILTRGKSQSWKGQEDFNSIKTNKVDHFLSAHKIVDRVGKTWLEFKFTFLQQYVQWGHLRLVLLSSSSFESKPESGRSHSEPRWRWTPEGPGWGWGGFGSVSLLVLISSSTSLVFFSSIIQSAKWWSNVAPLAASSFGSRNGILK